MITFRDVLDSDGLIARRRVDYERRVAQLAMAAEVDAAVRERRCLAVEAGTGVGKSLAYLTPAILYVVEEQVRLFSESPNEPDAFEQIIPNDSSETNEASGTDASEEDRDSRESDERERDDESSQGPTRVVSLFDSSGENPLPFRRAVISTHTISLQEQLIEKDVPALQAVLPFEFTVALAKGRSNYVCLRRFHNARRNAASGALLESSYQSDFNELASWLETTSDGSRSSVPFTLTFDLWDEICCEQGNCLGRKCRYRDNCFYYRARARLENARIIVVNHALLFSDVAARQGGGSILPNYDVLIFDEAHTMEQVAAEHIGFELTSFAVERLLARLYNPRANKGVLIEEFDKIRSDALLRGVYIKALNLVDDCRERTRVFFERLLEWLDKRPGSNGRAREKGIVENGLSEGLRSLSAQLRRASELLEDEGRLKEFQTIKTRVDEYAAAVDDWLQQRAEGFAYWLERSQSKGVPRVSIHCAPIDVAPILRAQLFNKVPTVIAASATLTTLRSTETTRDEEEIASAIAKEPDQESEETRAAFAFFRERVGLNGARARALGSPFNYREQMTLVLAKGLEISEATARLRGLSREERDSENERRLFSALWEYVDETNGGAFVLFTNAQQMRRATDALSAKLVRANYPFFSQADGVARRRMVQMFKESSNSVLFGVDSFWQGVDVPGNKLRNVVIVKLPFLSPTHPLVEARSEQIEERGGSSFRDYALPTAILKFKQGVGRLIRTRNDVGQVVVLDERVHTKSYGRDFLRALPDCKLRVDQFQ